MMGVCPGCEKNGKQTWQRSMSCVVSVVSKDELHKISAISSADYENYALCRR